MSASVPTDQLVAALRSSLKEAERLRRSNRQLLSASRDPVAIVGMSCRYPGGVDSPEGLWDLAIGGVDAITEMPNDRGWDLERVYDPDPHHPGTSYTREGGFLSNPADFDADFFGISPREALLMDPHQRLLLEVCWEAIEDAGIDASSLRGTRTGVFAGSMYRDYGVGAQSGGDFPQAEIDVRDRDIQLMAGASSSAVSGRVAYSLGLEGPAVSIDTACSSSLVAVHLACQAVRAGECSLALAAGVAVLSTPSVFIGFSRQRALAPDGRCKPFADSADGTSVAEGVGVVLLERLADARRQGHTVLGVIRGSAVNQDGASNGLTAPNGPAQERVIRQCLASAGLAPRDIDAVEAHGTGTTLGDPIEAQALLSTYGQQRSEDQPLWLGSVKSNIGHTQAAAGMAGLIKMLMALRHEMLAPTLHVDVPSTHVDWSSGSVSLLTHEVPWRRGDRPRRAGVSSFGFSGTNAHVILEEAPVHEVLASEARASGEDSPAVGTRASGEEDSPEAERQTSDETSPAVTTQARRTGLLGGTTLPWVISAKGSAALRGQAKRLIEHVSGKPGVGLADIGHSLACTRAIHERRAVVLGGDREELIDRLSALAEDRPAPGLIEGAASTSGGVVFVFPGQGAQWDGMAVELLDSSPTFAQTISACEQALAPHVDWSLEAVLRAEPGAPGLERVDVVQPALFSVMVALAGLWRACGVIPAAVVGHSQGEIAAAHVAGGLSLQDAARVVALRSRALTALAGRGGMVSVALEFKKVRALLEGFGREISIAAVNSPSSVVLSGDSDALEELLARCEKDGIRAKRIPVDYAAHSPHVEEIHQPLIEGCSPILPRSGEVPFYSAVTGGALNTAELDSDYWYRNLRETVRFDEAARSLLASGYGAFIEISPHPVLAVAVQETVEDVRTRAERAGSHANGRQAGTETRKGALADEMQAPCVIGSLRRQEGGPTRLLASLGEAWVSGVPVAWDAVFEGLGAQVVPLPKYPFQRRRYWLDAATGVGDMLAVGQAPAAHPLLGAAVSPAGGGGQLLTGRLSLQSQPWLADHAIMGVVVFPGAALLELALHAGALVGYGVVRDLTLEAPLILEEHGAVHIQLVVEDSGDADTRAVAVYSRRENSANGQAPAQESWTRNASGVLGLLDDEAIPSTEWASASPEHAWPPEGSESIDTSDTYGRLAELGVDYGPEFQGLTAAWRRGEEVFAEVSLCEERRAEASLFAVHPALLDAALHALAAKLLEDGPPDGEGAVLLPFACSGLKLYASGAISLRVRLARVGEGSVSVSAVDETGAPVITMKSLALRPSTAEHLSAATSGATESLLRLDWVTVPLDAPAKNVRWAVLGAGVADLHTMLDEAVTADTPATGRVYDDLEDLCAALDAGAPVPETVLVGFGLQGDAPAEGDAVIELARSAAHAALELTQAWLAEPRFFGSRLVVFTRCALAVRAGEDPRGLTAAPIWGLLRSAQSENPGRFVLVDIDDPRDCPVALHALLATEEPQLAVREGTPLAPRLAELGGSSVLTPPVGIASWRLSIGDGGTLESLHLAPCPDSERPLAPTEVRVGVRAAGVNFRDVVTTLGLVQTPGGPTVIGTEGAGVVLEAGSAVSDMKPGERVMGIMLGAFAPRVIADRRMIAPMPENWSFAQAAAVSGVFLTARYGLLDLGGLRPGEKLLVHAGAGGVGMAAIQIARHLGVEVFATASTAKWDVLRSLGLDDAHIASSRELVFRDQFLEETGGAGVDVVLNSLAREFVDASLELLPSGGRFLEMGKTDIRDPEQVAATHPGVAYRAFDLIEAGGQRSQEMLLETIELLRQGALRLLPIRSWDIRRAPQAFRFMSQARHVGKIVLTLPDAAIAADGTALITGGTGRLGGLIAKHLISEHGVRNIVLVSRRGRAAPGAEELETQLLALGAQVLVEACDVADRAQLAALIDSLDLEHPLKTVVHAAGVLDDGVIQSLDGEQLDRVLAPKLDAAWHLHELTAHLDLDAFLLFSSVSGTIGGPGQANYAAGNVFLDTLAAHRRAQGLPAVSMAWGGWAEASEMTGHLSESDIARVRRAGVHAFSTEQALAAFDAARVCGEALTVPLRLDRARLRTRAREGTLPALLSGLIRASAREAASTPSNSLVQRLHGVAAEERMRVTLDLVRSEVAVVLGHDSSAAIDVRRAFKDLGFDSLLAVELRNRLNARTGLQLPATLVFDYPSSAELARHLLEELSGAQAGTAVATSRRSMLEEPVALVAMGCRYPGGVSSPEELWELLAAGVDAISAFPADRGWDLERLYHPDPDHPATSYVREGGFVHQLTDFDAEFFGISPREAVMMDPQQRLLLEVAWETFERAGIAPDSLRGSSTGMFAGTTSQDYSTHALGSLNGSEGYLLTGTSASVLSGRVAYTLGLEGPAVTIDTACSSSLVAMHLACAALRSGECSLAIASGVTALCTPLPFLAFSRQRGLAVDGRCKSFADAADGTGVSEGIGLVLLERLSDAQRHGHPVLAIVRGSAINQDGASNGLSAPNGPAQQRVICQALANARLSADQVDAVEAHGTGTTLGDPIEAQALLATYGQERPTDRPLWLGSIKSNIGHTQAAAGVAGVIKLVMAMRHGVLPKTLHVDKPTTQVDWSQGEVSLLTEAKPWAGGNEPRRAGVSSFGVSGTNAHLILEEPPQPDTVAGVANGAVGGAGDRLVLPLVLSGRGGEALRAQAQRMHGFISGDESIDLGDTAFALAARAMHDHRAVVLGEERHELLDGLRALAAGEGRPNVLEGIAGGGDERVAFLFTGQGAQRAEMGRELYLELPRFSSALDEVCAELNDQLGRPLQEVLFAAEGSPEAELLQDTMFAQAGLFALETALFRLLESWHVRPDYLIGHSIGELAAAHAAGVFSLKDACRLVAARGQLMSALPRDGMMIAVQASRQEAEESLVGFEERVAVAAVNGPSAVVLSGETDALLDLAATWEQRARKVKRLRVSHAFHSPLMDGMLEQFAQVTRDVALSPPTIPIVSNLTGGPAIEELCSPEYWVRHVRETVRYAEGIAWLGAQGVSNFLELGPDGVLSSMTRDCLGGTGNMPGHDVASVAGHKVASTAGHDIASAPGDEAASTVGDEAARTPGDDVASTAAHEASAVAVLRAGRPELSALLGALAEAWTRGAAVDWSIPLGERGARRLELPTYPFQRQRYWLEGSSHAPGLKAPKGVQAPANGAHVDADETRFWEALEHQDLDGVLNMLGIEDEDQRSSLDAVLPTLSAWRKHSREHATVNSWRYSVAWKPVELPATRELPGSWVVIVPSTLSEDQWLAELLGKLTTAGERVELVSVDAPAITRAELAQALHDPLEKLSEASSVKGVLSLLALQEQPHAIHAAVPAGLVSTAVLVQALDDLQLHAPLWLLTRSAVSVSASERLVNPTQAQVWGLGLALGLERPTGWGGLVDLPETLDERVLALLLGVLGDGGQEDQLALRGGGVFARRLQSAGADRGVSADSWSPSSGTAMITGGLGGLGAHVARWLASAGTEHLLLVSRSGDEAPGATELCEELRELGAQVTVAACDVSDREQLARLIDSLPEHLPLRMVVHAAGASVHGAIGSLEAADLQQALAAKAQGALNLDLLTKGLDLHAFVLFSSIAGTLGSGEQSAYAAANAYLDALAVNRRARGLPATSIAWGAWAGEGMAAVAQQQMGDVLRRRGLEPMAPQLAIEALQDALVRGETLAAVADIRWETYAPLFTSARPRPLIEDMPAVQAALVAGTGPQAQAAGRELRARLRATPTEKRPQIALDLVSVEVARVLGHPSVETIDAGRAFKELGFDSLLAVELRNRLSGATGLELEATLVFDYPTPSAVAEHLLVALTDGESSTDAVVDDEVGRLERSLLSLDDPSEQRRAGTLLRAVLAKLDRAHELSEVVQQESVAVAERLQDASDDELFGFIDQQLEER
ncbi:MAG TPA: SDR family NAD(P)-dependent oxidoreductase [Solirubrobacteraceae bacterium]|nr:SDR family NAD(P)-dependent oxidoreductase [Solirubrobacteraceae bacterium]